jgi:hypothetical protein
VIKITLVFTYWYLKYIVYIYTQVYLNYDKNMTKSNVRFKLDICLIGQHDFVELFYILNSEAVCILIFINKSLNVNPRENYCNKYIITCTWRFIAVHIWTLCWTSVTLLPVIFGCWIRTCSFSLSRCFTTTTGYRAFRPWTPTSIWRPTSIYWKKLLLIEISTVIKT